MNINYFLVVILPIAMVICILVLYFFLHLFVSDPNAKDLNISIFMTVQIHQFYVHILHMDISYEH